MGEESPGKVCGIVKVKQELVGAKKTYKVKKYFCFQLNIRNYLCFEPDPDHPCEERLGEFPPLLPSSPSHVPSRPYVHLGQIEMFFALLFSSPFLLCGFKPRQF